MQKIVRLLSGLALVLAALSCDNDQEAEKPIYIKLDAINVRTDYDTEGTAQHNITTAWIYVNQEPVGAFELPATVPAILPPGDNQITIYPGVNLNGQASVRAINDAYQPITLTKNNPNSPNKIDTITISQQEAIAEYRDSYTVFVVEDFDETGLNLEPLIFSDTSIAKVSDPDSTFDYVIPYTGQVEDNGRAGYIALTNARNTAEFGSVNSYTIPRGTQNIYLEVTYRTNVNVNFGVVAEIPGAPDQKAITATVFPKEKWSKIYINLITEVLAYSNASGYKLYITAIKPSDVPEAHIFLDNLKLVYIR